MMEAAEATHEIRISIPPDSRFIALTRTTAAALGAELELTVDEIDDLRMAANELVGLVIEWAEEAGAASVDLCYQLSGRGIRLEVTAAGADTSRASVTPDPLAAKILSSVADGHSLGDGYGWLEKRRDQE